SWLGGCLASLSPLRRRCRHPRAVAAGRDHGLLLLVLLDAGISPLDRPARARELTMRAWLLDAPASIDARPVRLPDLPLPEPGPGEGRVRARANALCRTDLHVVEGDLPPHRQPVTPGHQVAGTVDGLGPRTTRFRPGDRVGVPWLRRTCG